MSSLKQLNNISQCNQNTLEKLHIIPNNHSVLFALDNELVEWANNVSNLKKVRSIKKNNQIVI